MSDVADLLYTVLRAGPVAAALARLDTALAKALTRAHERAVSDTLADVMVAVGESGLSQDRVLVAVQDAAAKHLGPALAARAGPAMLRAASVAYDAGRGVLGAVAGPDGPQPAWRLTDQRTLGWLQSDGMYWVGGSRENLQVTAPDGTQQPLGWVISQAVQMGLEAGKSSEEIGKELRGLVGSKGIHAPKVKGYWRGVAANAATRGASMGSLAAFEDAGGTRYEWVSVLDERTSEVCRTLDGTVWQVADLQGQREAALRAVDPDAMRAAWPWPDPGAVKAAKAAGNLVQPGIPKAPPAHFHCRSTLAVTDFGAPGREVPVPEIPEVPVPEADRRQAQDAWDPADPALYVRNWQRRGSGDHLLGTVIAKDGYGVAQQLRRPPWTGLQLAHWPTVAPPVKGRWWWAPGPTQSPMGGMWRRDKAPAGAITAAKFAAWRKSSARRRSR